MKVKIIFLIMVLALVSTACSISFNVPRQTTGELVAFPISEQIPDKNEVSEIELQVGAAELNLESGSSRLLEGEIRYNNPAWEPKIKHNDNRVVISQPRLEDGNIFSTTNPRNEWDLKIGSNPIILNVNAGAYKGKMTFSDYAIKNFTVNDGASDSQVNFKTPNKIEMESLVYKTGASSVDLYGLANANFEKMNFDCGAGSYHLDFSGELVRDAFVNIQSGVSNLEITIPEGVSSQINVDGGLNNIALEGTWTSSKNTYTTKGDGPTITINIDMGVGNIRLISN